MPMLPLHVGWCLPLPIPSSYIVLPTQKLTSYPTLKLTIHTLPDPKTHQNTHNQHTTHPKNTPVKQCPLLTRSSNGSVARAPTPSRMLHPATALRARPGPRSAMPSWLAQRRPRWQGQQEWIIVIRLALLRCQQLGLLLPGRELPPAMGPSTGRGIMPLMGHLMWQVMRPSTTGRLPTWGAIVQALLLAW